MDKPRIVFCLPGATFTKGFLESWNDLVRYLHEQSIAYDVATYSYADIHWVRNNILKREGGAYFPSAPWDGAKDYTHIMWIDSDQTFTPAHVMKLIADDKDIVSAVVPISAFRETCVGWYVNEKQEDGRLLSKQLLNIERLQDYWKEGPDGDLMEVDFTGFGFLCVKHGVFEALDYPWFETMIGKLPGLQIEFSEDMGWCWKVREAGFSIYADVACVPGHEKQVKLVRGDAYQWAEQWLQKQGDLWKRKSA